MNKATHLQNMIDGRIYVYSDVLARRKELQPVTLVNDSADIQASLVPEDLQGRMRNLLNQLRSVELQRQALIDSILEMPGGDELLAMREPPMAAADRPSVMSNPLPPVGGTPDESVANDPVAATVAPGEPVAETPVPAEPEVDPELMAVAQETLAAAAKKLDSQERYLTGRLQAEREALDVLDDLEASLPTADGPEDTARINGEIELAKTALKGAKIKVKSANTKLANAKTQYADAEQAIEALKNPG